MTILALITTDDIAVWGTLAVAFLTMIAAVGGTLIAVVAKLKADANAAGLLDLRQQSISQQSQISAVQLATPITPAAPSAAIPATKIAINHDALATALAPTVNAAVAAAVKAQTNWPTPSQTIPPKAQQ